MGQPKVVKRLIEAYEAAKKQANCEAMADIALKIERVQNKDND